MGHRNPISSEPVVETRPASEAGVDYTPKELSRSEALKSTARFLAVAGAIALLFWLAEKFF